ncbi:hypothetical protein JB92DRAFT_3147878 [Gautieria morchelliformis]|nr:hypothetical protein JB92DRAFT_3147878 [Gautieria morchelliformis]
MEDGPGVGLERERTSGIRTHLPLTEFSSPGSYISTFFRTLNHQTNLSPSSPSSLPIPTSGEKQMSSSSCSYSSEQVENLMKALASKGLGPDDIIKSLSNGSGTSPRLVRKLDSHHHQTTAPLPTAHFRSLSPLSVKAPLPIPISSRSVCLLPT